eukprot:11623476-Ditylum_brightwellii.AAC.1
MHTVLQLGQNQHEPEHYQQHQELLEQLQKQVNDVQQKIDTTSKKDESQKDEGHEYLWNGPALYHDDAKSIKPVTDK